METLILFIRDEVAIPSIGEKKADKFMPFLLTTFFFIWVANFLGLIPFFGDIFDIGWQANQKNAMLLHKHFNAA